MTGRCSGTSFSFNGEKQQRGQVTESETKGEHCLTTRVTEDNDTIQTSLDVETANHSQEKIQC